MAENIDNFVKPSDNSREKDVRSRINYLLCSKPASLRQLSNGDENLYAQIRRQFQGSALTFNTLSAILDYYPEVSAEWLLRGKGFMQEEKNGRKIEVNAQKSVINGTQIIGDGNTASVSNPGQNNEDLDKLNKDLQRALIELSLKIARS